MAMFDAQSQNPVGSPPRARCGAPPSARPRCRPARLNTLNLTEKYAQARSVNPVRQQETRPLMIKVVEVFDHELGSRSRAILPDRCPAAPLRGHRLRLPGTRTTAVHLFGRGAGAHIRSAPSACTTASYGACWSTTSGSTSAMAWTPALVRCKGCRRRRPRRRSRGGARAAPGCASQPERARLRPRCNPSMPPVCGRS